MNAILTRRLMTQTLCLVCVICLCSSSSTVATGTSGFLRADILVPSSTNQSLEEIVMGLRKQSVLVGLEIDENLASSLRPQETPEARETVSLSRSTNTLQAVLDSLVHSYPSYNWQIAKSSDFINIIPAANAVSAKQLAPLTFASASLKDVFEHAVRNLGDCNISLVEAGRSRPVYDEIFIDIRFPGGTLMEFLNQVALRVGGKTSWTLTHGRSLSTVQFQFIQPANTLATYKSSDYSALSPAEQLIKARESLTSAHNDIERVEALKKIASLTSSASEATECFDQAIALTESVEEKWWLKATKLRVLWPPGRISNEAALQYQDIIQNCPYEDIALFAVFDAAHQYRALDQAEEGAAMLKDAYHKYPSRAKSIRGQMQRLFPEYVEQLPRVDKSNDTGTYSSVFFESPPSNDLKNLTEHGIKIESDNGLGSGL